MSKDEEPPLLDEAIAARIHWIRGEKVMLVQDLAALHEVLMICLNEAPGKLMEKPAEERIRLGFRGGDSV